MINYIEKGLGLHKELEKDGIYVWHVNGVAYSNNDTEAQIIIDAYDPLPIQKTEKKAELVRDSEDLLNQAILNQYPRFEIDTWQNQKADSEAYIADNNAVTVTLDALSSQRGKSKSSTANKILEKAGQFAAFSAMYAGERQRLEDLVDAALTVEEVQTVKFKAL